MVEDKSATECVLVTGEGLYFWKWYQGVRMFDKDIDLAHRFTSPDEARLSDAYIPGKLNVLLTRSLPDVARTMWVVAYHLNGKRVYYDDLSRLGYTDSVNDAQKFDSIGTAQTHLYDSKYRTFPALTIEAVMRNGLGDWDHVGSTYQTQPASDRVKIEDVSTGAHKKTFSVSSKVGTPGSYSKVDEDLLMKPVPIALLERIDAVLVKAYCNKHDPVWWIDEVIELSKFVGRLLDEVLEDRIVRSMLGKGLLGVDEPIDVGSERPAPIDNILKGE